jgi:hypothetical protein
METKTEKPARRVIKLKKTAPVATEAAPAPQEGAKAPQEAPQKVKKTLKLKKPENPLPPPPATDPVFWDRDTEIIESVRQFYAERDEPVPVAEVDFLFKMLEHMKTEDPCAPPQWLVEAAKAAEAKEEADPYKDLGPMPPHGTKEFWSWCWKRKALKAKHDAAIIAAGGVVPEKKVKKAKAPKA